MKGDVAMQNLTGFLIDLRSYPLSEQISMAEKLDGVTHLCTHATGYSQGYYQAFVFSEQKLDIAEFLGISPSLVSFLM